LVGLGRVRLGKARNKNGRKRKMKTQIKRYGHSLIIVLSPEFLKYHKLKEGDWLDISDVIPIKSKEMRYGK